MSKPWSNCVLLILFISITVSSLKRYSHMPLNGTGTGTRPLSDASFSSDSLISRLLQRDHNSDRDGLDYDFYRSSCPNAEEIVRNSMARIHAQQPDVSAALLRLTFHDCFIEGCDASILLDDSGGNRSGRAEKHAPPSRSLRGFDKIDMIKEEIENECPGVVSCADILVLATREGIVLAGGPFYPLLTGRRDSAESYYAEALAEIPKPNDNIEEILRLFSLRGFNERETVSLIGAHSIGSIGCEFIEARLHNFLGTGQPDPTIGLDFLNEMRLKCDENNSRINSSDDSLMPLRTQTMGKTNLGLTYIGDRLTSISSRGGFSTHYFRSLLRGRGLLYADQQLMANDRTASLVIAYASDESAFRKDFARAMLKMSSLGVLTGTEGCSQTLREESRQLLQSPASWMFLDHCLHFVPDLTIYEKFINSSPYGSVV